MYTSFQDDENHDSYGAYFPIDEYILVIKERNIYNTNIDIL